MNLNRVILTGNLTRDPELRSTTGGTSVAELGVAVNEREKVNGEWRERANFFNVTVWGSQAENAAKYLQKGSPVAIDGRLRWESWEKDGQKRSTVKVVAQMVQYLSQRNGESAESASEPDDGIPF